MPAPRRATAAALSALLAGAVAVALAAPAEAQGKGRTKPGRWEISATLELPGGLGSAPPTLQTECLSQADVDGDPLPELEKGACKASDIRRSGDRVTWKVDCGPLGRGGGELHYVSPTAWEGSMSLEAAGLPLRASFRARRLGAC